MNMVADGDMIRLKSKPATAVIYALGLVCSMRQGRSWNHTGKVFLSLPRWSMSTKLKLSSFARAHL